MRRCGSLFLLMLLALISCRSTSMAPAANSGDVRLFAESADVGGKEWVLPQSGVHIACVATPVTETADVANLSVVTVPLGQGVLVELTAHGRESLSQWQSASPNRRLVLVINNAAVGSVRLDRPVLDGRMVFFVEVADSELPALVDSLKPALASHSGKFLAP